MCFSSFCCSNLNRPAAAGDGKDCLPRGPETSCRTNLSPPQGPAFECTPAPNCIFITGQRQKFRSYRSKRNFTKSRKCWNLNNFWLQEQTYTSGSIRPERKFSHFFLSTPQRPQSRAPSLRQRRRPRVPLAASLLRPPSGHGQPARAPYTATRRPQSCNSR